MQRQYLYIRIFSRIVLFLGSQLQSLTQQKFSRSNTFIQEFCALFLFFETHAQSLTSRLNPICLTLKLKSCLILSKCQSESKRLCLTANRIKLSQCRWSECLGECENLSHSYLRCLKSFICHNDSNM